MNLILVRYAGDKIAGGVKPEEFDVFHELIAIDEVARCGSGGVLWALFAGLSIGLPPLLHFAAGELRDRVCIIYLFDNEVNINNVMICRCAESV